MNQPENHFLDVGCPTCGHVPQSAQHLCDQPEVAEWERKLEQYVTYTIEEHSLGDSYKSRYIDIVDAIKVISSHEEKVRADWLRSEIEKLEGEIEKPPVGGLAYNRIHRIGMNLALTSIITRYKEELKVLTGE